MLDDGLAVVGEPHVMTGMTPNPLLAFSSSSSPSIDDVTPMAGQPPSHPKGGGGNDDDDDDDGGGGGSPNNPMDLPLMRISIPEPAATPLIPMHMGGTSVMVPNPMISQFSVPSPLASPTYTVDDTDTETDGNTTTNANATTTSTTSSWPYYSQSQQPQPPPPSASSSSVGTSASTIHAMAKVVVGSAAADGVEELVVVAADGIVGEGMGGSSSCSHARDEVGEEEYDTVDDGEEDVDMEEYYDHPTHSTNGQQRLRRRANTMSAKMEADVTNRMQYVTSNLPPSTTATTTSDNQDQEAVIFGEEDHHHLSQPMNSQDHYYQQQQSQPHQEYAPQTVLRIPSPASPPPPSSNMVRSYSYSGGNASAYYGSIMASAHSSSGSLYSEHTMSHSETDSPTMENCWRIGDSSTSSSVGVIANSANAVMMKPHHVMSSSDSTAVPQVHFHTHQPLTTTTASSSSSGITPKTAGNNGSAQVVAAPSSSSSLQQQAPRPPPPPPADKRQKRLERNRESARVSRRRRKFYLEELECKVTKLSEEMDTGRMKHACDALPSVRNARAEVLNEAERCLSFYYPTTIPNPLSATSIITTREEEELPNNNNAHRKLSSSGIHHNVTVVPPPPPPPPPSGPNMMQQQQQQSATLHNNVNGTSLLFTQPLSRTNDELHIVQIFMKQQLSSLVQPTMTKFVLWLSLQNEEYYRGGRSASERLSAARIGERLLHRGTTCATSSSDTMWPLICHEISLSYEQEEKVRNIQRLILSNVDSWVQRHTALATRTVMESVHDVLSEGHAAAKARERDLMYILTPEQRMKFLVWARRNRDTIRRLGEANMRSSSGAAVSRTSWVETTSTTGRGGIVMECGDEEYMTSPDRHVAANLYIINHLLSKIKQRQQQQRQPTATPTMFVHPSQLKKLSRRPSFESLAGLQAYEDSQASKKLSRETSFPSTGSLKRSLNEMTLEGSHSDLHSMNSSHDATSNGVTPASAQGAGQAAVLAVLGDIMPIVPKEGWCNPSMVTSDVVLSGAAVPGGTSMAGGAIVPHSQRALPTVTSQPPMQAFLPAPSATHPPKRRHTTQQSQPIQQNAATGRSGGVADHQPNQPQLSDIPIVDDIPMPTPVSVLLRTSDDYFSLFEPHEPTSTTDYATSDDYAHSYIRSNSNSSLLNNRHRSAPQLASSSRWGSSPSHPSLPSAHMAVIPELEPVSIGVVADYTTTEQLNSFSHSTTGMLGNSHQSAPQLYSEQPSSFLSGTWTNNSAETAQANEGVPQRNDREEFAILEDLPLNMEADDWAIGEDFPIDF